MSGDNLYRFLNRRPVLWLGAGASIQAGYPSVGKLADDLWEDYGYKVPRPDTKDPFALVDAFVEAHGEDDLTVAVSKLFSPRRRPARLHQLLAQIAKLNVFAAVVTTNYDELLEDAFKEQDVDYALYTLDSNDTIPPGERLALFKIHGDERDWRWVVLTSRSYELYAERYPFASGWIDWLLREHYVLFVGCSMLDPRLLSWLAAQPVPTGRDWVALLTADERARLVAPLSAGKATAWELLQRVKSQVFELPRHEALSEWFELALEKIHNKRSTTLRRAPLHPLPLQELMEPLEILLREIEIPKRETNRLFRLCAPPFWDQASAAAEPCQFLLETVRLLAQTALQRGGNHPLLCFLSGIIQANRIPNIDLTFRNRLQAWIGRAAEALLPGAGPGEKAKLTKFSASEPKPAAPRFQELLLQIEPSRSDSQYFLVKAWLRAAEPDEPSSTITAVCLSAGEELCVANDLPKVVSQLRREAFSYFAVDPLRLSVELMLPRKLVCLHPCDQWPLETEFVGSTTLGSEMPLSVRSLERAQSTIATAKCIARWKNIEGPMDFTTSQAPGVDNTTIHDVMVRLVRADEQPRLHSRLRELGHLVGAWIEEPVAEPKRADLAMDAFNAALEAGLGVLVWLRGECGDKGEEAMRALLSRPLSVLRQSVWDERRRLSDLGQCITLIWDNPTRPFPDFDPANRFAAPKKRAP